MVDIKFRTMYRFLQQTELFLTLCLAIKHGDIGLIRCLVDPIIINFIGGKQTNYVQEMLYYRWNLTSINEPDLQTAILASGLVNWIGDDNIFKPIDLALEHLNADYSIDIKNHKNSAHTWMTTFDRVCSLGKYYRD